MAKGGRSGQAMLLASRPRGVGGTMPCGCGAVTGPWAAGGDAGRKSATAAGRQHIKENHAWHAYVCDHEMATDRLGNQPQGSAAFARAQGRPSRG